MEIIIIYHFILVFWGTLIGLFGEKIIIGNPFFKGFIVEAEVVEMLDFSMLKKHIFVTVVKYKKYDMVVKTFVFRGKSDKIGDTIQILTNGDITVRTKFYWKKDNSTAAGILFLILTILMIWLIIECIEIVKLQHLLVGMFVVIVALLLQPLLYGLTYRDVQSHIHMID